MKKIYTLFAATTVVLSVNAQTKSSSVSLPAVKSAPSAVVSTVRAAAGDTLFLFDGNAFYGTGISSSSVPPFDYANDDIDNKDVATALASSAFAPKSAFVFFYDLNSVTADTNSFLGATSWFNPLGAADNWFSFGPVTIPAGMGGSLTWKHNMPDGAYRDGYKVFVSTTGLINYADFVDAPVRDVADNASSTAGDTVNTPDNIFVLQPEVNLAAFSGMDIYIGFQHEANDQFILYLDDIMITETVLGIEENAFVNGVRIAQNMPNPFKGITAINYELQNSANVTLSVYDVTGKMVAEQREGNQSAGRHIVKVNAQDLAAGVYYYSLRVNDNTTAAMKMVVIK